MGCVTTSQNSLSAPHKERQLSHPLSFHIYCSEPVWRVGEEALVISTGKEDLFVACTTAGNLIINPVIFLFVSNLENLLIESVVGDLSSFSEQSKSTRNKVYKKGCDFFVLTQTS